MNEKKLFETVTVDNQTQTDHAGETDSTTVDV